MPDTTNVSELSADGPKSGGFARAGDPADVEGGGRAVDFADAAAVISRGSGDDGDGAGTADASVNGQTAAGSAILPGPCSCAGITCEDAADIARGGDGGNPEYLGNQQAQLLRDDESARLMRWSETRRLLVADGIVQKFSGKQPPEGDLVGGQEHIVQAFSDADTEGGVRLWKITKGDFFGVTPCCDGSSRRPSDWFALRWAVPPEYLCRLALLEHIAPETETRLEGFAVIGGNLRILTSQRYFKIREGEPSPAEVEAYFKSLGFTDLLMTEGPEWMTCSWYHRGENLAVFDAWPKNIIRYEGRLYPVDVIPISPGPIMAELIKRALEVPLGCR